MRALSRGLAVLEFITLKRGASVTEIRRETGLSKAVIYRILGELVNGGYIWRGMEEKKYYSSGLLAVSAKGAQAHALMYAARDPLQTLVQHVQWPSDLLMRDGIDMVLIDTTQSMSPYGLRSSKVGVRVPILLSPSGHAILAEMSQEDRENLYEELRRRGEWKRQLRMCGRPLVEIIAEVKARGFALGAPNFGGEKLEEAGSLAIAAPIVLRRNVIGAVRIWWRRPADGASAVQVNYIGDALRVATSAISASLEVMMSVGNSASVTGRAKMTAGAAAVYSHVSANLKEAI